MRILTFEEVRGKTPDELRAMRAQGLYPPMAGGALESNILGLWVAKQSGRGAPVTMTTGTKKGRWVGGDLQTNRADGTEPYSDGTLFGDTVDFVNTLIGNGTPVLQGQSGIIAYLSWLAAGQETVTGGANAVQTLTTTGTPAGGTFKLTFNGFVTAPIAYNASAANVQTAILAAIDPYGRTLPAGSILCAGGPVNTTPVTVTFQGALALRPVPLFTADNTGLTGGSTPAVTPSSTTVGVGNVHVATPNDLGGFYSTWVKSVGKTTVHRSQYNDGRIQSLRYEASSASKVFKITPTFISLDPGQLLAADPSQGDDGTRPFLYTEAASTFTIDGAVYRGHSAYAIEAQWGLQEWYGDDVVPFDVINQRATVLLQGITIILDAQALARYNLQLYGSTTPAVNAKPLHTVAPYGSYQCTHTRLDPYTGLAADSVKMEVPSVKWDPNLNIPASPTGGAVEFPMAAEFRKTVGQPAFRVTVTNADAAYSS